MSIRTVVTRGFGSGGSIGAVVLRGYFPEAAAVVSGPPGQEQGHLGGGKLQDRPGHFGGRHVGPAGGYDLEAELAELQVEAERLAQEASDRQRETVAAELVATEALEQRIAEIERMTIAENARTEAFDALLADIAESIARRKAALLQRRMDEEFLLMAAA